MSGSPSGQQHTYASPTKIWAWWLDYTALPWVNNYSVNLQNCAQMGST